MIYIRVFKTKVIEFFGLRNLHFRVYATSVSRIKTLFNCLKRVRTTSYQVILHRIVDPEFKQHNRRAITFSWPLKILLRLTFMEILREFIYYSKALIYLQQKIYVYIKQSSEKGSKVKKPTLFSTQKNLDCKKQSLNFIHSNSNHLTTSK